MKIKNKGFTLIELMVTVAIIGILGAIAVPAYQDYTIRSQVTEGLSLASGAKVQVAEYYANHGRYPETMADIGMVSSQGSYIQETRLDEDGKITTIFGKDANKIIHDGTISLIPTENDKGNLEWNCYAKIEQKYLPNSCVQDGKVNPDGSISYSDGSIEYPDGSVKKPDGVVYNPDGSRTFPDGSGIKSNGEVIWSNAQVSKYGGWASSEGYPVPPYYIKYHPTSTVLTWYNNAVRSKDWAKVNQYAQTWEKIEVNARKQNDGILPDDFPQKWRKVDLETGEWID